MNLPGAKRSVQIPIRLSLLGRCLIVKRRRQKRKKRKRKEARGEKIETKRVSKKKSKEKSDDEESKTKRVGAGVQQLGSR